MECSGRKQASVEEIAGRCFNPNCLMECSGSKIFMAYYGIVDMFQS